MFNHRQMDSQTERQAIEELSTIKTLHDYFRGPEVQATKLCILSWDSTLAKIMKSQDFTVQRRSCSTKIKANGLGNFSFL